MDILGLIIYIFIAAFTPGPNNMLSLTLGKEYGYKKSLVFIYGVCTVFL